MKFYIKLWFVVLMNPSVWLTSPPYLPCPNLPPTFWPPKVGSWEPLQTCPQQGILNWNTCHALRIACIVYMVVVLNVCNKLPHISTILFPVFINFGIIFVNSSLSDWSSFFKTNSKSNQYVPVNLLISVVTCTALPFYVEIVVLHHDLIITSEIAARKKMMVIFCVETNSCYKTNNYYTLDSWTFDITNWYFCAAIMLNELL